MSKLTNILLLLGFIFLGIFLLNKGLEIKSSILSVQLEIEAIDRALDTIYAIEMETGEVLEKITELTSERSDLKLSIYWENFASIVYFILSGVVGVITLLTFFMTAEDLFW